MNKKLRNGVENAFVRGLFHMTNTLGRLENELSYPFNTLRSKRFPDGAKAGKTKGRISRNRSHVGQQPRNTKSRRLEQSTMSEIKRYERSKFAKFVEWLVDTAFLVMAGMVAIIGILACIVILLPFLLIVGSVLLFVFLLILL